MSWQYTHYAVLSFATAATAGALAFYAWRRHHGVPGAKALTLLLAALSLWAAAYALELSATGLAAKIFWAKAQYPAIAAVPLTWLAFALEYTGREGWLTLRNLTLLGALPLLTLLLVLTNEAHGLVWSETALDASGSFAVLRLEHGPGFWAYWYYSYLLLSAATVLLVTVLARSPRPYVRQNGALLLAAAAPWLGNALYVTGYNPLADLDLTPFSFLVSGVTVFWRSSVSGCWTSSRWHAPPSWRGWATA